jgi:hypothetical protein
MKNRLLLIPAALAIMAAAAFGSWQLSTSTPQAQIATLWAQAAPVVPGPAMPPAAQPGATPDTPAAQDPDEEAAQPAKPDPCSAIKATGAATTTSSGPGFPDEGFDVDETTSGGADAAPKPQNPVQKVCENGRVQIRVGSGRSFGTRIGSIAAVRILLQTDSDVVVDFTSLTKAGALAFGGSDFVLAKDTPASIRKIEDGRHTLYVIDLRLQTFVIKDPGVSFNLDLRYATAMVPGTKTPDWKVLSTPDFFITRSNTADNGQELLEGTLQNQTLRTSWVVWPLYIGGCFLIALWPGLALVHWVNRINPLRKAPKEEIAWNRFKRTVADAQLYGWELHHYKRISAALRWGLGYSELTRKEILNRVRQDEKLAAKYDLIEGMLTKLDDAIYNDYKMTREDTKHLLDNFPKVIEPPVSPV